MRSQETDLFLQLVGVKPVIISFTDGNVDSCTGVQAPLKVSRHTDVFIRWQDFRHDFVAAKMIRIILDDFWGLICGVIISNDQLDPEIPPLGENALQTFANVFLLVV